MDQNKPLCKPQRAGYQTIISEARIALGDLFSAQRWPANFHSKTSSDSEWATYAYAYVVFDSCWHTNRINI